MGNGGAEGDRTLDLRIANATLSQLSYRPTTRAAILGEQAGCPLLLPFVSARCTRGDPWFLGFVPLVVAVRAPCSGTAMIKAKGVGRGGPRHVGPGEFGKGQRSRESDSYTHLTLP